MNFFVNYITTPVKKGIAAVCYLFPFSVAEFLVTVFVLALLLFLGKAIYNLIKKGEKLHTAYRVAGSLICIAITIYGGFCILWGANYYADSFQDKSGILAAPSSVDALYETTRYFALKVTEAGEKIKRDENGSFAVNQPEFFDQSVSVYRGIETQFPVLSFNDHMPKKILVSEFMSYTNFTGFYFPFTGEANINSHCPNCLMPATIAHEMAHQRNVASEDEANFVAVLACISSGNPTYEYSGYLLGFIYLNNALYGKDQEKWQEVRSLLSDEVNRDMSDNNQYWLKYKTKVQDVTTGIYDGFLKSYGQEEGIQSYGEVVDLLIAWYTE